MKRVLPLCSLLLLPLTGCDEVPPAALDLAGSADRPTAIPDPIGPVLDGCEVYCSDYLAACGEAYFGYASLSECASLCGYWETDEASTCRFDVLVDIALHEVDSPELACVEAGPDSDACGSAYVVTCERYCGEFRSTCSSGGDSFDASFESLEKCQEWCDAEVQAGEDDSIACRLGALTSWTSPPDCEAASPDVSCK